MSATIHKQLNDIFEEVYHLFNDSIMVSENLSLNDNVNRDIERHKQNQIRRENGEYVLQDDDWYVVPDYDEKENIPDDDNWQEVDQW